MGQLIDTMKRAALTEYIIIDTPPALFVPDAQILAGRGTAQFSWPPPTAPRASAAAKAFFMLDPDTLFAMVLNGLSLLIDYAQRALWALRRYGRYGRYGKYSKYADSESDPLSCVRQSDLWYDPEHSVHRLDYRWQTEIC